jgi:hypothetical protein
MLRESNCYTRKCKWYKGAKQPESSEMNEFHYCEAFPDGIPREINLGNDLHDEVKSGQTGNYVYEEAQ